MPTSFITTSKRPGLRAGRAVVRHDGLRSEATGASTVLPFLFQEPVQHPMSHLVVMSRQSPPSVMVPPTPLAFMTLMFLKSDFVAFQLFCSMVLYLDVIWCFLMIRRRLCVTGKNPPGVICPQCVLAGVNEGTVMYCWCCDLWSFV